MYDPARPVALESLEDAARFAWKNAPLLCKPEHGCMRYHRTWGLIRLLLRGGNTPFGEALFRQGLAPLAQLEAPRILISGGADTGLLALAFDLVGAPEAEFVFADLCATPVAANRAMGDALGRNLKAVQADIITLKIAPVDAILAHSFLNFFTPETRPHLVANWARLLKPGGRLILMNHLVPSLDASWVRRDPADDVKKAAQVRARVEALGWPDIDPAEAEEAVKQANVDRALQRRPTEAELRQAFVDAGLVLEVLSWDVARLARGPNSHSDPARRNGIMGVMARKLQ